MNDYTVSSLFDRLSAKNGYLVVFIVLCAEPYQGISGSDYESEVALGSMIN